MLAVGAGSGVGARMLRPPLLFNPLVFDRAHDVEAFGVPAAPRPSGAGLAA